MIPISLFITITAIAFWMMMFTFLDDRHRLYANIVIAFTAAITYNYLGTLLAAEAVTGIVGGQSMSIIYYWVAFVMYAYTLLYIVEIILEIYQQRKEEKARVKEEAL
jgi:predicted permease